MATLRTQMNLRQVGQAEQAGQAGQTVAPRGVFVPQDEYNRLVRVDRLYANLTRNLLNGGITEEMLAIISRNGPAEEPPEPVASSTSRPTAQASDESIPAHARIWLQDSAAAPTPPKTADRTERAKKPATQDTPSRTTALLGLRRNWDDSESDSDGDTESLSISLSATTESRSETRTPLMRWSTPTGMANASIQHDYEPANTPDRFSSNRSIQIFDVPDTATLGDVTAAIRGGKLLEIHELRLPLGAFVVSFIDEKDARAFHDHYAYNHPLLVKGKKVGVRWADRQATLSAGLRRHVGLGCTRNLIITNYGSVHTEQSLRDDLEHIHRLKVLKIELANRRCYIHTNSVDLARTARTCMMSRLKYKGSEFKWAADECAEPLVTAPLKSVKAFAGPWSSWSASGAWAAPASGPPSASRWSTMLNPRANRFEPLSTNDKDFD